jgi:hypothetical protein
MKNEKQKIRQKIKENEIKTIHFYREDNRKDIIKKDFFEYVFYRNIQRNF